MGGFVGAPSEIGRERDGGWEGGRTGKSVR